MQAAAGTAMTLAVPNVGAWEMILVLALVLILIGARKLPEVGRGLGRGISEFRRATKQVADEMDEAASEAGRSTGGIYGKRAAEALTPDNQVAELYDPAALQDQTQRSKRRKVMDFNRIRRWIRLFVCAIRGWGGRR
jgi:sec-independent protein translocase protein TatA